MQATLRTASVWRVAPTPDHIRPCHTILSIMRAPHIMVFLWCEPIRDSRAYTQVTTTTSPAVSTSTQPLAQNGAQITITGQDWGTDKEAVRLRFQSQAHPSSSTCGALLPLQPRTHSPILAPHALSLPLVLTRTSAALAIRRYTGCEVSVPELLWQWAPGQRRRPESAIRGRPL